MDVQRVALVFSQSLGYCRGVLHGVMSYAANTKPWAFRLANPESPNEIDSTFRWDPHGIIGFIGSEKIKESVCRPGKIIVNTSNSYADLDLPRVGLDDVEIGRLGAQHFLDRGFQHFVTYAVKTPFYNLRRQGFLEVLGNAGFSLSANYSDQGVYEWFQNDGKLHDHLLEVPKPVAIFAASDPICWRVVEACHQVGVRIPDEVALLGVDNDEFLCKLARPPMSSVQLPLERIGFEAASLLDRLLVGNPRPAQPILLPPVSVVTRQSTDVMAVADPDVAAALQFIREHSDRPIRITDILRKVAVSRRSLELKFRKTLGRTPLQEIHRVQIERAKSLLVSSDLPMADLALKAGFTSAIQFWWVFKRHTSMAPVEYRLRYALKKRFAP